MFNNFRELDFKESYNASDCHVHRDEQTNEETYSSCWLSVIRNVRLLIMHCRQTVERIF